MSIYTTLNKFVKRHAVIAERMNQHGKLSLNSDAVLARKGYSRELIEAGLPAWPWHASGKTAVGNTDQGDIDTAASQVAQTRPSNRIRQAAQALNRYNVTCSDTDNASADSDERGHPAT